MITAENVYALFAANLKSRSWPPATDDIMRALHAAGKAVVADSLTNPIGDSAPDPCLAYYKRNPGEFMTIDFCCMARCSNDMLMAAESEMSEKTAPKIVDDDFQKLVYLKARFKVLLFRSTEVRAVLDRAKEFLRAYTDHASGENYLFISFDASNKRRMSACKWTVVEHGPAPQADFAELGEMRAAQS